jgi:thiol-disulfide isomerase/thioredoxin
VRLWDGLALAVLAFIAWKWLVAPRALDASTAYNAPRVSYKLLDGGDYRLAARRGHVVFLDFWASWCAPCKVELPIIEAFARKHPATDVVLVNVGEPRAVVAEYARAHDLRNVALDGAALSQGYFQLDGFPTVVVVDPQGRIRATWAGFNPAVGANMANAVTALE